MSRAIASFAGVTLVLSIADSDRIVMILPGMNTPDIRAWRSTASAWSVKVSPRAIEPIIDGEFAIFKSCLEVRIVNTGHLSLQTSYYTKERCSSNGNAAEGSNLSSLCFYLQI
jgi:hypothetical protein